MRCLVGYKRERPWVQGDGLIQIFIGLLHMAELGVRQPAMLIGSGIAGRRLDGLRICGNSFRIALCEKVCIPSQKVTAWGAGGPSCSLALVLLSAHP